MSKVVPRGLEPRTLRLLAVRSNQLSYETNWHCWDRPSKFLSQLYTFSFGSRSVRL